MTWSNRPNRSPE